MHLFLAEAELFGLDELLFGLGGLTKIEVGFSEQPARFCVVGIFLQRVFQLDYARLKLPPCFEVLGPLKMGLFGVAAKVAAAQAKYRRGYGSSANPTIFTLHRFHRAPIQCASGTEPLMQVP